MSLFKRSQKVRGVTNTETVYKIVKRWSPQDAKYMYYLKLGKLVHWSDGTSSVVGGVMSIHDPDGWFSEPIAHGDKLWAEKNAKHYGIEIEEEDA